MSTTPPISSWKPDVATLAAVADLVINLSIAARSHQIYGHDHPMAKRAAEKAMITVQRSLELASPIPLHFTPEAVFCGPEAFDRNHPIFRRFAQRMWHLGIAGLRFERGVSEEELVLIMDLFGRAEREALTRREIEHQGRNLALWQIHIEFLHELVSYEERDVVAPVSNEEQQELWEQLIKNLSGVRARRKPGEALVVQPVPESEALLTEALSGELPDEDADDYAEAVVDYMRELQRSQKQDVLLQQTEFGRKVADFLANVHPELRHQIMSHAVSAPEVSPEVLQGLIQAVGFEQLVDSLQHLSLTGKTIPPSAFRTLSLLSAVSEQGDGEGSPDISLPAESDPGDLQRLIDGLMSPDRGSEYMSPDYEGAIRNVEQQAENLIRLNPTRDLEIELSIVDNERHFLQVAKELLAVYDGDTLLAARIDEEAEETYKIFVEEGAPNLCRQAMQIAREARQASGLEHPDPFIWETEQVLVPLTDRLTTGDRWESQDSAGLMVTIGRAAIPNLIEVLTTSDSISARKRALETLENMKESPAELLLPLLDTTQPWYVQRNAVYVLRRRGEADGAEAAKQCWRKAPARLQTEILGYLFDIEDGQRYDYLWQALTSPSAGMMQAAVRTAMEKPTEEAVETIEQRLDELPTPLIGTELHLSILRMLARSGLERARRYVAEVPSVRTPLAPWKRDQFRRNVEAILEES